MFKPSILQINQIHIIIFHQGYNLANIPKYVENRSKWIEPMKIWLFTMLIKFQFI
jgi:hypothetical protein